MMSNEWNSRSTSGLVKQLAAERADLLGDSRALNKACIGHRNGKLSRGQKAAVQKSFRFAHQSVSNAIGFR